MAAQVTMTNQDLKYTNKAVELPPYYNNIFTIQEIDRIRQAINKKEKIDDMVRSSIEFAVSQSIQNMQFQNPSLYKLFQQQYRHRPMIREYWQLIGLKCLIQIFLDQLRNDKHPINKQKEKEICQIWQAMKNYYDDKKKYALRSFQGRITTQVLQAGKQYFLQGNKRAADPLVNQVIKFNRINTDFIQYYLTFEVIFRWAGRPESVIKRIAGTIQMQGIPEQSTVQKFIKAYTLKKLGGKIKSDARWDFSRLRRQGNTCSIKTEVQQELVNIHRPYFFNFEPISNDFGRIKGLFISNEYGDVQWLQDLNVLDVDFSQQVVKIEKDCVRFSSPQLRGPCLFTVYNLPSSIKRLQDQMDDLKLKKELNKLVQNQNQNELVSVNWEAGNYTIFIKQSAPDTTTVWDHQDKVRLQKDLQLAKKQLKGCAISSVVLEN